MTRNISRETAQNSLDKKLDVPKIFYGWLGNSDDVVDVPGRVNYVYVTMTDGMVTQAYNVVVPSILNLPVICGYDQNQLSSGLLKVLSVRNVPRQTPNSTNPGSPLVSHHKTHEWMNAEGGQDVTFMELRQYMPFRPSFIDPFTVRIERGVLKLRDSLDNGVWTYIPPQTIDLSEYVPLAPENGLSGSNVLGRYVLVYIPESVDAFTRINAISGSLMPITEISPANIPESGTARFPICAVLTYYYQEKFSEARTKTDLIDLRFAMFDRPDSYTVFNHNDLVGLQGGFTNEYYHLTAFQHATAIRSSSRDRNGYLSLVDYQKFDAKLTDPMITKGDMIYKALDEYPNPGSVLSGSAFASSSGSPNMPGNVLDGDDSTYWESSGSGATGWLYIDFGSVKSVAGYKLYHTTYTSEHKYAYWLQKSDTAVSGSWVNIEYYDPGTEAITIRTLDEVHSCRYLRFESEPLTWWGTWRIRTLEIYEQTPNSYVNAPVRLPIGAEGTVLTSMNGMPTWAVATSGSQVVPNSHTPVANYYLTGYDKTSGSFSSGSVSPPTGTSGSHNDLSGLQGGASGEYYHLTGAQHTIATQASGSGQDGYLKSSDFNQFKLASAGSGAWYLDELLDVQASTPAEGDGFSFTDSYWHTDKRRLSYVIDSDSYDDEWSFSGSTTHSGTDLIFNGTPNGSANSIFPKLLPNIRYKVQTTVTGLSGGTIRVGAGAEYPTFPISGDGEYVAYFTLAGEAGNITVNVASGSPTATLTGLSFTPCYLTPDSGGVPLSHSPVENYYLTGYDVSSGSFSSGSVACSMSGSQVVPVSHVPVPNFYLTGYDATSGSWASGSVVGGASGSGGIPEAPIDGKTYGRKDAGWTEIVSGSGGSSGSGASTFLELTDTPSSYSGQAGKVVAVNSSGTGLEFVSLEVLLAIGFFSVDIYVSDGDSPV